MAIINKINKQVASVENYFSKSMYTYFFVSTEVKALKVLIAITR